VVGRRIQRLIGDRRGVVDLTKLGERDHGRCDVLQAGGNLTASITGGSLAAAPITTACIGTWSAGRGRLVGIVVARRFDSTTGDSHADVDFNVVGTDDGAYVELRAREGAVRPDAANAPSTWPTPAWPACSRRRPRSSPPSSGDPPGDRGPAARA
jgi:ribonuclease PH